MKHIAIRKGLSYFYTDSNEIDSDVIDSKLEPLEDELRKVFAKHGLHKSESLTCFYNVEKYSITNCSNCESLMINRDSNPAGISSTASEQDISLVLLDGGVNSGQILCEECLPQNHRWSSR